MAEQDVRLNVHSTGTDEVAEGFNKDADAMKRAADSAGELNSQWSQTPDDAARAAEDHQAALEGLVQQEQTAIDATQQLTDATGVEAESLEALSASIGSVDEAFGALETAIESIKSSDLSLDDQRQALEEMRDTLQESVPAFEELGDKGADAVERLTEKIEQIDEELKNFETSADDSTEAIEHLSDEAGDSFEDLENKAEQLANEIRDIGDAGRTGFGELDDVIERAEEASIGFFDRLEKDGQVSRGDLRRLVIAHEELRSKIIETFGSVERATPEVQASYKKIEASLDSVTAKANQFTNAVRDHSVRLRETGDRINGVANVVQQAGRYFGESTQKIVGFAGSIGEVASGLETAKDAMAGMNLNTVSLTGSTTTLGVQLGLIVTVLAAAIGAGSKLADTLGTDKEAMNSLTEDVKKAASSMKKDMIDWTSGVQEEIAKVIGSVNTFTSRLGEVDLSSTKSDVDDLAQSLLGLGVAWANGGEGSDVFFATVGSGLDTMERLKLAVNDNGEAAKFFADAQAAGVEGMKVWRQATLEAGGTAEGLATAVKNLRPELDAAKTAHEKLAEGADKVKTAHDKASDAVKKMREEAAELAREQKAESDAIVDNVAHLIEYNDVVNGSTKALNEKIASIKEYLPNAELHSVALDRLAGELKKTLDSTDGLTRAQREHIQSIVDAAKKADELTEAQKKKVAQDAEQILKSQDLKKSQDEINVVWENGKAKVSNVKAEVDGLTVSMENGKKTISNAAAEQNKINVSFEDGKVKISNTKEAMSDLGNVMTDVNPKLASNEETVKKLAESHGEVNPKIDEAADRIRSLAEHLATSTTNTASLRSEIDSLGGSLDAAIAKANALAAALVAASRAGMEGES